MAEASRASNFGSIFLLEKPCHIFVPQSACMQAVDRRGEKLGSKQAHTHTHADFSSSSLSSS